jgi:hypothetical protein
MAEMVTCARSAALSGYDCGHRQLFEEMASNYPRLWFAARRPSAYRLVTFCYRANLRVRQK